MSTAVIDYGAGNIRSVENAMRALGEHTILTSDPGEIRAADHVILPGVGAFGDAMENIRSRGLEEVIGEVCRDGVPFLGICLGLQILFEESEESPGVRGLSLLKGKIKRFPAQQPDSFLRAHGMPEAVLKIPEIGWNSLQYPNPEEAEPGRLFAGIPDGSHVYFVHSYYLKADDPSVVKARADYGISFDASVEAGNLFACQFHPEKSERVGMQILKNFLEVR